MSRSEVKLIKELVNGLNIDYPCQFTYDEVTALYLRNQVKSAVDMVFDKLLGGLDDCR